MTIYVPYQKKATLTETFGKLPQEIHNFPLQFGLKPSEIHRISSKETKLGL